MKLETRFNLIISICLAIGLSISGVLFYRLQLNHVEDTLIHDAALMLEYGQAVRNYTSEEVMPALMPIMGDEFLPQTVPSYAAHTTINKLHEQFPGYTYREVALNPTNPSDRGDAWEVGVIQKFRGNTETEQLSGKAEKQDSLNFFLAKPIRITDSACLVCHGDPATAPANMRTIYGNSNGFGWKMGEIVGARIVTVPADAVYRMAKNNLFLMLVSLICIFLLTHAVFNFIFRRYVVRPLENITSTTEDASLNRVGEENRGILYVGQFVVLDKAINRLRRSLDTAISMIEKNR